MNKDKILVEKILSGDEEAIRNFYQTYSERLGNFIRRKVSNSEDMEEIRQDAFISTLNSLPNFSFRSSLYSYLCAIANHEIIDYYRRKKLKTVLFSRFPFLETIASQALTPEEETLKKELKREVKEALRLLLPGHSRILNLKYLKQFSVKEIARLVGKSPKSVESILARSRKKLAGIWRHLPTSSPSRKLRQLK